MSKSEQFLRSRVPPTIIFGFDCEFFSAVRMLSLRKIVNPTWIRSARMFCVRGDGHLSAADKGKIETHTGQVSLNPQKYHFSSPN